MKKKLAGQISVFMPAYNEQENISQAINSIDLYLKERFVKYEIIVVDDGSRDKTNEIVREHIRRNKHVKLVTHPRNMKYGAALISGFRTAKYDPIFYTDADCQYNIKDINKLLPLLHRSDIVAGYRLKRQDPWMRIAISKVYNLIIWLGLGLHVKDVDCAFKLYRRKVFTNMDLISQTGLIDAEVLVKALRKGRVLKQVGVAHYPRTRGQTTYELGRRNKFFALVKPQVIVDLMKEMFILRSSLQAR